MRGMGRLNREDLNCEVHYRAAGNVTRQRSNYATEQSLHNEISEVDAIVITTACLMSLLHPFVTVSTCSMFSGPIFWCYIRVC